MQSRKTEDGYIVVLEKGDRVIESLTVFGIENNISCGTFSAIGAVNAISMGYYSLEEKKYYFEQYPEDHEVASGTGNFALKDGKPFVHLHMVLSKCDGTNQCIGGHIQEATVAVTLEVFIKVYRDATERKLDDIIGLFLICP